MGSGLWSSQDPGVDDCRESEQRAAGTSDGSGERPVAAFGQFERGIPTRLFGVDEYVVGQQV